MSVLLDLLIDFVFPKFCVVCDREGAFLCRKCKQKLPLALQVCPMCTRPSIYGLTHEYCRKKRGMSGLISIFDHRNEGVKKAVEAIKFGFNRELVEIMLSGWKMPKNWEKGVVLVPVPLHRYRQNWRGFNQAELIARVIGGKKTAVIMALTRIKATAQQANVVDKKSRSENLKGCFRVDEEKLGQLAGKKIVLVDDVFTSGATMRECVKELRRAGVRQVWGFCLAR